MVQAQQSQYRLRMFLFFVAAAAVSGGLCALYELGLSNVEDRDARDMLYDHRVTSAGMSWHHQLYFAKGLVVQSGQGTSLQNSLTVGGLAVTTAPIGSASATDTNFFGWSALWPWPLPCPDTGYVAGWQSGVASGLAFPTLDLNTAQLLPVSFLGSRPKQVPYYRVVQEAGQDTATISLLQGVIARVAFVPVLASSPADISGWRLSAVEGVYGNSWTGPLSTAASACLQCGGASGSILKVELHDVSEPVPLTMPKLQGQTYIYAALALGLLIVLAASLAPCFITGINPFPMLLASLDLDIMSFELHLPQVVTLHRSRAKLRGW